MLRESNCADHIIIKFPWMYCSYYILEIDYMENSSAQMHFILAF
jgi:hypothetical protein